MLRTQQGRLDRAPTPADDIAAIANEPAIYVPGENHRNPSGEAKHKRDILKDYFIHIFALAGQGLRCEEELHLGTEEADFYQSFSGLPNYSKNFY